MEIHDGRFSCPENKRINEKLHLGCRVRRIVQKVQNKPPAGQTIRQHPELKNLG